MTSAGLADTAPDFAEPLEAWRVWRIVEFRGELSLASVVKRLVWPAGEPLAAECLKAWSFFDRVRRRAPHAAPGEKCACGIYATALERIGEYLTGPPSEAVARVFGRVALWGSVVECERGFRASNAYPLALYVPVDAAHQRKNPDEVATALERYGVPVELLAADPRDAPSLLRPVG